MCDTFVSPDVTRTNSIGDHKISGLKEGEVTFRWWVEGELGDGKVIIGFDFR